jgi:phosphotransferase system enzyme I (PtsI)
MGLDEFSVAPAIVPMVKDAIRSISFDQARKLADSALKSETASEVLSHCRRLMRDVAPELMELV